MRNKFVIGIDIGGTNTEIGIVDKNGIILKKTSFKTQEFNTETEYLSKLTQNIKNLISELKNKYKFCGIGIGAPNGNYYTETIKNAPNLKWGKNVRIVDILKKSFDVPIKITNDANASAIGEKIFGKAKELTDFVTVTLGTGLGSGFFVNGQIMYGKTGFAGELGHTIAIPNGRICGCGRKGCLETYVSATGIKTTVLEMLENNTDESTLRDLKKSEINSKAIYNAAIKGDKTALAAFDFTGKILGEKLADTIALFSPQAIFLSGGLALAGDLILNTTKKYTEQNTLNILKETTKIEISGLLNKNSGILGASALIDF